MFLLGVMQQTDPYRNHTMILTRSFMGEKKTFTVRIKGKNVAISINRLKPAYIFNGNNIKFDTTMIQQQYSTSRANFGNRRLQLQVPEKWENNEVLY